MQRLLRLLLATSVVGITVLVATVAWAGTDVQPGQTGNEPNNAVVNPRNPSQVAVAQGCQIRISNNFGQTFPVIRNTTLGCNGDPSMAFDSQGRLFFTHLTRTGADNELTVVAGQIADTTTAGTQNYTPIVVSADDGNDDDKPWLAADANPSSPFRDNLYLIWTRFTGIPGGGPTAVQFSRSINQGAAWSAPQVLSAGGEGFVWPPSVAVGTNGDVYVAYHTATCGAANTGTIPLLRDGNGGANFAAGVVPQKNNAFGAGQATVTCNVQNNPLAGTEIPGADFWLQGSVQPWILPDPVRAGNVYVIANDDPNNAFGNGDDADVVIARSSDFGVTFTLGRVDHGPGQSFAVMPTAHIDQDGNIAVHWYDNRGGLQNTGANANFGTANFLLDLYGTTSVDGGLSFVTDFRINDAPFDPDVNAPCRFGSLAGNNCTERIGEYNGVWTVDGIGYATWTGNATPPAPPFPSNGAGAQTTNFDLFSMLGAFPDRFEPNESIDFAVVASLGSDDTYNQARLTLHTATDVDFFKVVALHTGKLEVALEYNERIAAPGVRVWDALGNLVPTTGLVFVPRVGSSTLVLAVPVVQGNTYFVEVLDSNAPNTLAPQSTYDLHIVNRAAPVPFELDLVAASDSGSSDSDNVTNDSTPTIRLRVDTVDAANEGINILTPAEVAANNPGYAVAVFRDGNFVGYASPVGGTNETVWEFTFPGALADGGRSITAKVRVFDASNPQANGFGGESDSLLIAVDTVAPAAPSIPDLLASSDSGASDVDNITNVNPPAFQGTGEANAKIQILANNAVVGQGTLGSDGSDGVLGNGLGAYEITIEPLADGTYAITARAEDLAGNIGASSAAMAPSLVIDTILGGGQPQRPTLDLVNTFDTGRSDMDNVTNLTTVDVRVTAEPGATVDIKDGNAVIDTFVMPAAGSTTRTLNLAQGPHPLSAEQTDAAGNRSHQSEELLVTVDTTAPATPAAPDLLSSSDTGGIDDDNVTTLITPKFAGMGEANARVQIYAAGVLKGQSVMTSFGTYEVTVEPLADGVHDMTVKLEDLAGNISAASPALKVTIASQVLNLPGGTASGPAGGLVTVNLADGAVAGSPPTVHNYPGIAGATGKIGIADIPVVNLDVGGQALTILGTAVDDGLRYTPLGALVGMVTRDGSAQVINFTAVVGAFTIDPLAGSDTVSVMGTASPDPIQALANVTTMVQVGGLKAANMPIANVERLAIISGQGVDRVDVTAFDGVNANLFIEAGEPTSTPRNADVLMVRDGSGRARLRNQPGGAVPNSGSIFVEYLRTTGNTTRIDYVSVERVRLVR